MSSKSTLSVIRHINITCSWCYLQRQSCWSFFVAFLSKLRQSWENRRQTQPERQTTKKRQLFKKHLSDERERKSDTLHFPGHSFWPLIPMVILHLETLWASSLDFRLHSHALSSKWLSWSQLSGNLPLPSLIAQTQTLNAGCPPNPGFWEWALIGRAHNVHRPMSIRLYPQSMPLAEIWPPGTVLIPLGFRGQGKEVRERGRPSTQAMPASLPTVPCTYLLRSR